MNEQHSPDPNQPPNTETTPQEFSQQIHLADPRDIHFESFERGTDSDSAHVNSLFKNQLRSEDASAQNHPKSARTDPHQELGDSALKLSFANESFKNSHVNHAIDLDKGGSERFGGDAQQLLSSKTFGVSLKLSSLVQIR